MHSSIPSSPSKAALRRCRATLLDDAAQCALACEPRLVNAASDLRYPPRPDAGYGLWHPPSLATRLAAPAAAEHAVYVRVRDTLRSLIDGENGRPPRWPALLNEMWAYALRRSTDRLAERFRTGPVPGVGALAHAITRILVGDRLADVDPVALGAIRRFPPVLRDDVAAIVLLNGETIDLHAVEVIAQAPLAILFPDELHRVIHDRAGPTALMKGVGLPRSARRIGPTSTGPIRRHGRGALRRWATPQRLGLLSDHALMQRRQVSLISALAGALLGIRGTKAEDAINWAVRHGMEIGIGRAGRRAVLDIADWIAACVIGACPCWVEEWSPEIGPEAALAAAAAFARAQEPGEAERMQALFPPPWLPLGRLPGDERLVVMYCARPADLILEGRAMSHCLGNAMFAKRAAAGLSQFYSVRALGRKRPRVATLEVIPAWFGGFEFRQVRGFANGEVRPEVRGAVEAWLDRGGAGHG